YKRALELDPGNATVIGRAGLLAQYLGRSDQAIVLLRRRTEIDPLNQGAYYDLARALYYAGQYDKATAAYKKRLELDPHRLLTHGMLGTVYLAQSRPQQALDEATKETDPAYRLYGLALAYHALGRKKE